MHNHCLNQLKRIKTLKQAGTVLVTLCLSSYSVNTDSVLALTELWVMHTLYRKFDRMKADLHYFKRFGHSPNEYIIVVSQQEKFNKGNPSPA